ncbi:thioredoxin family protein [Mucilaginibacter sp. HD30]
MKKRLILSLALLMFTAITFAQTAAMPSTEEIMNKAYAQAKKENKKVLVMFHASWCGWCKKMEASINEPTLRKFFDDNYVIATLDVMERKGKEDLENPGSLAFMTKYKGEKSGLPFWFIADATGKKLADSQIRAEGASLDTYGENVGCLAAENEVAFFAKILKNTSKLKDSEIAMISERFAKNKQ